MTIDNNITQFLQETTTHVVDSDTPCLHATIWPTTSFIYRTFHLYRTFSFNSDKYYANHACPCL